MTVIKPGSPGAAPYRRKWVLKNIKGLAYEAPDPKNISTTFSGLVGKDAVNLTQLLNILPALQKRRLARFQYTRPGISSVDVYNGPVIIKYLNQNLLNKLIAETEVDIKTDSGSPIRPRRKSKPKETGKPRKSKQFSDRYPVLTNIYAQVTAGLIVVILVALAPPLRNYFINHIWHHLAR